MYSKIENGSFKKRMNNQICWVSIGYGVPVGVFDQFLMYTYDFSSLRCLNQHSQTYKHMIEYFKTAWNF